MEYSKKSDKKLLKGSFILLVSFGLFNLLNFLFHIVMARSLSVSDYGILATLFSAIYVTTVISESIQLVMAQYSSRETNIGKIKSFMKSSLRKSMQLGVLCLLIYIPLSLALSNVLKIDIVLFILNGLALFLLFFVPITRGVLQGTKRFVSLGSNVVIEGVAKLLFGFIFVFIGLNVSGALIGVIISLVLAFLTSFWGIRDILQSREETYNAAGIRNYSKATFTSILAIFVFYSIDVVIAKYIFSPDIAGFYAISSILAKSVFWGTQPISRAMFSISSSRQNEKHEKNILLKSFIIVLALIFLALGAFYVFPSTIVKIFSGKIIYESSSILFILGLGMGLLSISNLLIIYKLSEGKITASKNKEYALVAVIGFTAIIVEAITHGQQINSYLAILSFIVLFLFLAYQFAKKKDLGLMLFVVIEGIVMYLMRDNLKSFSYAFLISAAIFLIGTLYYLKEK